VALGTRSPAAKPFQIGINGKNYACSAWDTVAEARPLERLYNVGFNGGVGYFSEGLTTRRDQIYAAVNIDASTHPYARLLPIRTKTALTNPLGSSPTYMFVAEDSGGAEYVYVFSGRFMAKVALANDALQGSVVDFGAGAVAGHPVLFEGFWRIPLGDTVQWVTLTVVGVGDVSGDTRRTAETGGSPTGSRFATHFATLNLEGVAELWRSHNNDAGDAPASGVASCRVSGSADAITFGSSFEVGDTSLPITDLTSIGGLMYIAKPDSPWLFSEDGGGNAFPVMDFVGKSGFLSGYTGEDGSNSGSIGEMYLWTHSSGLWRVTGRGEFARPIDPVSNPDFSGLNFDSTSSAGPVSGLVPAFYGRWLSVASWGQWVYATEATSGLWAGRLEGDRIRWTSNLFSAQGTDLLAINRCVIVPTSTAPILYVLDTNGDLYRIDLQQDGSLRRVTASGTNHGGDDEVGVLIMPETDFGEPEVTKQVRMMWQNWDDFASAFAARAIVYRDRSTTPTQIGSDRTSGNGRSEHSATPGTNDTFISLHPAIEMDTGTFAEATEDPRLRSFGIRVVTPTVYRCVLPLTSGQARGRSSGIPGTLKALRNLKSGASVTVKEPGINATFTGYIHDVQERVVSGGSGGAEYSLEVYIQRWVL
jgi:hypothetical protein